VVEGVEVASGHMNAKLMATGLEAAVVMAGWAAGGPDATDNLISKSRLAVTEVPYRLGGISLSYFNF
jgi:hypothetical protein